MYLLVTLFLFQTILLWQPEYCVDLFIRPTYYIIISLFHSVCLSDDEFIFRSWDGSVFKASTEHNQSELLLKNTTFVSTSVIKIPFGERRLFKSRSPTEWVNTCQGVEMIWEFPKNLKITMNVSYQRKMLLFLLPDIQYVDLFYLAWKSGSCAYADLSPLCVIVNKFDSIYDEEV